jgi:hypothetical protein
MMRRPPRVQFVGAGEGTPDFVEEFTLDRTQKPFLDEFGLTAGAATVRERSGVDGPLPHGRGSRRMWRVRGCFILSGAGDRRVI